MPASNATFLATVGGTAVVYKPIAGERPLWDFPDGNLAQRERAAYLISAATGWDVVPPTWIGEGPHGPGMVQLWREPVDVDPEPVTLVPAGEVPERYCHVFDAYDAHDREVSLVHEGSAALRRMAVFDVLVNNADRKGGHVLAMADGHRYGVDHGITLHHEPKLRTVLWGWADEPLLASERAVISRLHDDLDGPLGTELSALLTEVELLALADRCTDLLAAGRLPAPGGDWPQIPWPPF